MKITRIGSMVRITLPGEDIVVCGKCGFPFRGTHVFSARFRKSCPRCGERGPFREATDADFDAFVESRRMKPSDYLKAAAGLVIVGVVAALIVWGSG
jgi:hypothetical protein